MKYQSDNLLGNLLVRHETESPRPSNLFWDAERDPEKSMLSLGEMQKPGFALPYSSEINQQDYLGNKYGVKVEKKQP